jgi:AcrR family transcriptional regulator
MARDFRRDAGHDERDVAEAIAQLIVDKVGDKLAAKAAAGAEKIATKADRLSQHAARHAADFDRLSAHLDALDVWMRTEPTSRRPRFTRDEIAEAAVRIADAEGFEAVSMRRLAAELGAGTMTLYHYVRTKDELLTLLTDAVMGEVVVPDSVPFPTEWKAALTLVAQRSRDAFFRHPWTLDITDDPPLGPNAVRHFDQSLQAVASLDLSLPERFDIVMTVDEYVFGYCLQARNNGGDDPHDAEMIEYVEQLMKTGRYPALEELTKEVGLNAAWSTISTHMRDPHRFDRNLARLLDGIEASFSGR